MRTTHSFIMYVHHQKIGKPNDLKSLKCLFLVLSKYPFYFTCVLISMSCHHGLVCIGNCIYIYLNLQSVPITTMVMNLIPICGKVYLIIKFVSDFRHVCWFLWFLPQKNHIRTTTNITKILTCWKWSYILIIQSYKD